MSSKILIVIISLTFIVLACNNSNNENQYTGILEGTAVKVPALTGGQILDLFVDTGDQVQKGQKIAVIDSLELFYQRQQLLSMSEELSVQSDIARTDMQRTAKDRDYVSTKYNRISELYKKQSASKQNLDDIENQLNNLNSAYQASQQKLRSIAARQKQIAAQINTLNKKIGDAVVISPASGIISSKYFEQGEAIQPLSALVEVMDIRTLETKIYISEKLLTHVKHGQKVTVSVDGLERELQGEIIWVSPKAEFTPKTIMTPETRTSLVYAVKIAVENQDGLLKDGMPVVVKLSVD
jgi:HlyD family secretion protein